MWPWVIVKSIRDSCMFPQEQAAAFSALHSLSLWLSHFFVSESKWVGLDYKLQVAVPLAFVTKQSIICVLFPHSLCSLMCSVNLGNSDTEIAQLAKNIMVRSLEIQNALLLFFLHWEGQGPSKISLKLNNTLNNHSPSSTDQLLLNFISHSVTLNLCLLIISYKSYMAQFKFGTMKLNMMFLWSICTIAYVRISLPFKTKYYFTKKT